MFADSFHVLDLPLMQRGVAVTPDVYMSYDSAGALSGVTMNVQGVGNTYAETSVF